MSAVKSFPSAPVSLEKNNPEFKFQFKILMLGDSSVGKTAIYTQFVYQKFYVSFASTIGVDYRYKVVEVVDSKDGRHNVRLSLWDTAGQERFRNITKQYYRGAHGIALVYDSTNRASFENVENWLESIEEAGDPNGVAVALVANKSDCENQQVSVEEGQNLAKSRGLKFFQTSAKNNVHITEMFMSLTYDIEKKLKLRQALEKKQSRPVEPLSTVTLLKRKIW